MIPALQHLRAEIKFDRESFQNRVAELASIELGVGSDAAQCARAAVALHHAYGAIESIMQRIARAIDGEVPAGSDWHQALLHLIGLQIDDIRPAIFSRKTIGALREILSFRQFFRHAYAVELDPRRLAALRRTLTEIAPRLSNELAALDAFLEETATASDD